MMNFNQFFDDVEEKGNFQLRITASRETYHSLNNEALFQLPLIALIILVMAKDRRKPKVAEIGQLVGESIEASMLGFKGSAQHLGWSANLRMRTVKALNFLEMAQLVEVHNLKSRITATEMGKKVVIRAFESDDDLSYNLAQIARAYRNICIAKQLDLELI